MMPRLKKRSEFVDLTGEYGNAGRVDDMYGGDPRRLMGKLKQIHKFSEFPTGTGPEDWEARNKERSAKTKEAAGTLAMQTAALSPLQDSSIGLGRFGLPRDAVPPGESTANLLRAIAIMREAEKGVAEKNEELAKKGSVKTATVHPYQVRRGTPAAKTFDQFKKALKPGDIIFTKADQQGSSRLKRVVGTYDAITGAKHPGWVHSAMYLGKNRVGHMDDKKLIGGRVQRTDPFIGRAGMEQFRKVKHDLVALRPRSGAEDAARNMRDLTKKELKVGGGTYASGLIRAGLGIAPKDIKDAVCTGVVGGVFKDRPISKRAPLAMRPKDFLESRKLKHVMAYSPDGPGKLKVAEPPPPEGVSVKEWDKILQGKAPKKGKVKEAYTLQGHKDVQGLNVAIENRKGGVRKGKTEDGYEWRTKMKHPYGYIVGTKGADGEPVDAYVGPHCDVATKAYVVHQRKVDGAGYDEDKVMLGFKSKKEAKEAYLKHYDDPKFLGPVSIVTMDRLKKLVERKKKLVKISHVACLEEFNKLAVGLGIAVGEGMGPGKAVRPTLGTYGMGLSARLGKGLDVGHGTKIYPSVGVTMMGPTLGLSVSPPKSILRKAKLAGASQSPVSKSTIKKVRKAGPGIGGATGAAVGALVGLKKGQLLKSTMAGLGTGATLGWTPDMFLSAKEALTKRKRRK